MTELIDGYDDLVDIGGGGFSRVYRARDLKHDRTVAIKVLDTRGASDSERRAFSRELKAMGGIGDHPHTVTVLESGFNADDRPFLVMPFFEAGTFADLIKDSGQQPVAEVIDLGIKVASALETVHQIGYLHRDVKPENIFVGEFGGHALGDFGISSITDGSSGTRTVGVALTPAHAAPEVWEDEKPTPLTDIYSLGSTLYNLLAARPPFTGDTHAALLRKVLSEDPPRIGRKDIPHALTQLIKKMLAKVPTDRPSSALEVANELREIQISEGLPATPITVRGWTAQGTAAASTSHRQAHPAQNDPLPPGANETVVRDSTVRRPVNKSETAAQSNAPTTPELTQSRAETPPMAAGAMSDATEIRSPVQKPTRSAPTQKDSQPPEDDSDKNASEKTKTGGVGIGTIIGVVAVLLLAGAGISFLTGGSGTEDPADDPADAAIQEVDPEDIGPVLLANDPTDLRIDLVADELVARWEGTTNPNIVFEVMTNGIEEIAETSDTEINLETADLLVEGAPSCVSVRVVTVSPSRVGEWVGPECTDS